MWNDGGWGFGAAPFSGSMLWSSDKPGPKKPDLKSIVAICTPQDIYTDDELAKLLAFSKMKTDEHKKRGEYCRGSNLIIFEKCPVTGRWMRKRLMWVVPSYSPTVDEAIAAMSKPYV